MPSAVFLVAVQTWIVACTEAVEMACYPHPLWRTAVVQKVFRPPYVAYHPLITDCKGSDFLTNHQTPGGPTGGGKRNECLSLLAIFSKKGDYKGTWRMKTYGF